MKCYRCQISVKNEFTPCFRTGNVGDILFIGEAPGHTENKTKIPFTGKSGMLLRKFINLYGLKLFSVLTNVIKCQPPRNRDPYPEEIANCFDYFTDDIKTVNPKIIVTVGRIATKVFINDNGFYLRKYVNKPFVVKNIVILPIYHPSYIIRENNEDMYLESFNIISEFYNSINPYYRKKRFKRKSKQ